MDSSCIQGRFAEQVRRTPDAVAVVSDEVRLTYRELDERANRLAHRLIGMGAGPEVPVAVLMERSADVVVAILAIVKTGGCYLPLHSSYPLERLQWIMDQAMPPVLLADEVTRERGLPAGARIVMAAEQPAAEQPTADPNTDPGRSSFPGQLAYVIYTSGSTGHPKGVAVTHRDVLGLALDRCWDTGRHERVLMVAPYAFNVSTYEIWVPLLHGGRIVVAPPGHLDPALIRRLITEHEVTGVHLTAGLFRVIAEEAPECLAGVREVLTGGDVIAPLAVRRVLERCEGTVVRAMYGATEATLFSAHAPLTAPYEAGTSVPIGGPMDDLDLYVLDDRLSPVPPEVEGDLYIAGRGVARAYYGRPDLTAERFVANPFGGPGARMYRTGDLVRVTENGLEFVGRATDLVKILGFRVEPAEVAAVLARYPGLADVAVVARETPAGERRLVAYVVAGSVEFDTSGLRAHAMEALPEYMVPAAFLTVDTLPLTPNGKLDRAALPEPDFDSAVPYRAPADRTQEILCEIVAEVLGIPRAGIDDRIFDLGGAKSLTAMRLVSRIRSALGTDLTIGTLFHAPTVAGLADILDNGADCAQTAIPEKVADA